MKKYRITEQALVDIELIQDYFLERRPEHIAVLQREFVAKFLRVARFPMLGIDSSHLSPGLRRVFVRDYVIYYRRDNSMALIIRVLHGARDIDASFFE